MANHINLWKGTLKALASIEPPDNFLIADLDAYRRARLFWREVAIALNPIYHALHDELDTTAGVGDLEGGLSPSEYIEDFVAPDYTYAIDILEEEAASRDSRASRQSKEKS
jgi:hypothetical protein